MIEFDGKSVYSGIAIGPVVLFTGADVSVTKKNVPDPEAEISRYHEAVKTAGEELDALYEKAVADVGEEQAQIFDVHRMMLEDLDYVEGVEGIIRDEKVNAEYACEQTGEEIAAAFLAMDDEYMSARSADIRDITDRLIRVLSGGSGSGYNATVPSILFADDLKPSETVLLNKSMILAFVTRHGSTNSHTAILARTMNIPAIVGADYPSDIKGKTAIVDGENGRVIIDPDEKSLQFYQNKKSLEDEKNSALLDLIGKENITKNGIKINVFANIGNVSDATLAVKNDAGGIGLFRSEFLYLESDHYPTEDEQFEAYKKAVEIMDGKKVIIRTLDIGADKKVDYFNLDPEENPAMGYRAIRICLDRRDIFKTQLRAIFRASHYGNIAIMFPMIISLDEVKECKKTVSEIKSELDSDGIPYGDVELGIMIETPAAVMISDELAKEVDFFSVGTNDLTQYTLAIDRQNQTLDDIYDAHHPAILKMLKIIVDNAHKGGAWAGICGELAADTTLTSEFIKMGYDELSVAPSMILKVRQAVRAIDLNKKGL